MEFPEIGRTTRSSTWARYNNLERGLILGQKFSNVSRFQPVKAPSLSGCPSRKHRVLSMCPRPQHVDMLIEEQNSETEVYTYMHFDTYRVALKRGGDKHGICFRKRDLIQLACTKLHECTRAIIATQQSLVRHVKRVDLENSKLLKSIRMLIRRGIEIVDERQDHRIPDLMKENGLLVNIQAVLIPSQAVQNAKFGCDVILKKMSSMLMVVDRLRDDKTQARREKMRDLLLPFCEQVNRQYLILASLSAAMDRMLLDLDILKKFMENATIKCSLKRALLVFSKNGFERVIDRVHERLYVFRMWLLND
jgi:hypothetical protein